MGTRIARRQMRASSMATLSADFSGVGGNPVAQSTPPTWSSSLSGQYPDYNIYPIAADSSGMTSTVEDIASRVQLGINIGQTMEAVGGETGWGNPRITPDLIDSYKAAGFDAIRLPCAWDQYSDPSTAKISASWLDRVKQVVQYCMDADLYVLLNIHWDGGRFENNFTAAKRNGVAAKQKAFWEQIATHLRDFDEHLMFASSNEANCDTALQMDALLANHQTFIDAVRSTGGRNAHRVLVLQLPSMSFYLAQILWPRMPVDQPANRLMVEGHLHTPSQFCVLTRDENWGRMFYYWGKDFHSKIEPDRNATWGEEDMVDQQMALANQLFASKGIPVVLGEYGAPMRNEPLDLAKHLASRAHWMKYVTQQARANGLIPFLWDTGDLISRHHYSITDQQGLSAVLEGAGKM